MHSPRVIVRYALMGLAAILIVTAAFFIPRADSVPDDASGADPALSTVQVTSGDMVSQTVVPGTIAYSQATEIAAGRGGVVTQLPEPGSSLAPGSVLYRIDTVPVLLLAGSLPAWRDFDSDMTDGDDVLQLEQNLAALGFFTETPDARFDWDTSLAIRDWQSSLGLERTGIVLRSDVVFWNGALRVDSVTARLGQDVGPGSVVFGATSLDKVVDLTVKSADRSLGSVGGAVTVTLPDGSTTEGIIQTIGAPLSRPNADATGKEVVIPMRIAVADQGAIAELALASVSVGFASTLRDDVLTVPVDALVPLDDTHYAVEVPPREGSAERQLVPVEVGAITSGKVEISGKGIVEGLVVLVPTR